MSTAPPSIEQWEAAGVLGAMSATEDLFAIDATTEDRQLLTRRAIGDTDPTDLFAHTVWLATTQARSRIRDDVPFTAQEILAWAVSQVVVGGPDDVDQLPSKLSDKALAGLARGEDTLTVLSSEWMNQAEEALKDAVEAWLPHIEARTAIPHPPVRVAYVTPSPKFFQEFGGVRTSIVDVRQPHGRLVATSALMHVNEAEELLDDDESDYTLLPSKGVSAERIETALRLRGPHAVKGEDPPMRSLAAALSAAAGVLGEDVAGPAANPSHDETCEALKALLESRSPEPPRGRVPAVTWAVWAA